MATEKARKDESKGMKDKLKGKGGKESKGTKEAAKKKKRHEKE
jgi:hypothetical protein